MARHSRHLGETGQAGGERALADAMIPKWRRAII
jgi:hypothetical protein